MWWLSSLEELHGKDIAKMKARSEHSQLTLRKANPEIHENYRTAKIPRMKVGEVGELLFLKVV